MCQLQLNEDMHACIANTSYSWWSVNYATLLLMPYADLLLAAMLH